METPDPTINAKFLIVEDGFFKNFLILSKIRAAFFPLTQ